MIASRVASKLKRKLIESVQRNTASGLLFSGGLDSGILAYLNKDINAITVSLKSFGKDIQYSGMIAKDLKLKYFYRSVGIQEAIEAIPETIKILETFDPVIPNDLVVYFGLKLAKELGLNTVMTGDGSDELFAGYSFMQEIDDLESYIKKMSQRMEFSSNKLGEFLKIKIVQPFLDKEVIDLSLDIGRDLKIRKQDGRIWGKWILRKAFEDILPKKIVWQSKRPLEYGSGMRKLREIISSRITEEEFKKNHNSIKFINKEHIYYYKVYKEVIGGIPKPKKDESICPACGAGMKKHAVHCKICGWAESLDMNKNIKAFCCWSGGKESAMSFYKAKNAGMHISHLVNMVSADGQHSRTHGIGSDFLRLQSKEIGVDIIQRRTSWQSYEDEFKKLISDLKDEGITTGIFGDIDLQEHRDWVERVCREVGVKPILPLWKYEREELLHEFIGAGFKTIIVTTRSDFLGKEWLGREINEEFIGDLKAIKDVDICGEKGEYHTFVCDGPIFQNSVKIKFGKKVFRDNHWFMELK